jgi:UDP-N-acetylmuramoyl-tripeptide--D-alanyl-D-alanine ligase
LADGNPLWTLDAFLTATGGRLEGGGKVEVNGISIDSRTLEPGDAFFAISGDRLDGHDFVAAALEKGAALAVIAEERLGEIKARPLIVVPDVLAALKALAKAARARSAAKIIAVTGSVGKTGTKEALKAALGPSGETHVSQASYNNHWGVPLSLARMPGSARYGVFEVGMNHAGEIRPLSKLIRPHVAIITTVEPVHLAHFESIDKIAGAKAEVFEGFEPGATAILNCDNNYFSYLSATAVVFGAETIIGFGSNRYAEARLEKVSLQSDCSTATADILGQKVTFKIGAPGRHLVENALAVLAAVKVVGADLARAALALASWSAPTGRGQRHVFRTPRGPVTVIDESYNANPASMRAAIATLGGTEIAAGGRRIAVLGDMLELGPEERNLHAGLARPIAEAKLDLVFTVGNRMTNLRDALERSLRAGHADSAGEMEEMLLDEVRPGDVVMIKGSYATGLGPLVRALERNLAAQYEARPRTAGM